MNKKYEKVIPHSQAIRLYMRMSNIYYIDVPWMFNLPIAITLSDKYPDYRLTCEIYHKFVPDFTFKDFDTVVMVEFETHDYCIEWDSEKGQYGMSLLPDRY